MISTERETAIFEILDKMNVEDKERSLPQIVTMHNVTVVEETILRQKLSYTVRWIDSG